MSDLEARLEAARERAKEAESKLQAQRKEAAAELELAELDQRVADAEAIAAAEAEHGPRNVLAIDSDGLGVVILKRPNPVRYRAWQDTTEKISYDSMITLVQPCVVHPDPKKDNAKALDKILDARPGLLQMLLDGVTRLAGFRAGDVAKK